MEGGIDQRHKHEEEKKNDQRPKAYLLILLPSEKVHPSGQRQQGKEEILKMPSTDELPGNKAEKLMVEDKSQEHEHLKLFQVDQHTGQSEKREQEKHIFSGGQ